MLRTKSSPSHSALSRRCFIGTSAAAGIGLTLKPVWASSVMDHVHVAVIGAGGRGGELAQTVSASKNAELIAVADPDLSRAQSMADKYGAKAYSDLRKILDDPSVNAVMIAACNHWHCLAAMWAIDAGKHVYVEKPLSHSQWEGRQVVNAAKKSGLVVQIGTQQRSDPMQAEAKAFLHTEKALGEILFVQANRLGPRGTIGRRETPLTPPESVDYNLWLGPAEDQPIMRANWHYDWHWDWNTGSGEMGNWGVHILDDVRNVAYQDSVTTPTRIVAAGGRVGWSDAGNTPNVHFAVFETDSFPTLIALSNLPKSAEDNGSWSCKVHKNIDGPSSGYVVACEGGYYMGERQRGKAIDLQGKTIREFRGGDTVPLHIQNFLDSVISQDVSKLNGSVEQGHYSTGWCNLANAGVRAGATYNRDELNQGSALEQWPLLMEQMEKQLEPFGASAKDLTSCPILTHDPETESFVGEHADRANAFLKRTYREGFEVREVKA